MVVTSADLVSGHLSERDWQAVCGWIEVVFAELQEELYAAKA